MIINPIVINLIINPRSVQPRKLFLRYLLVWLAIFPAALFAQTVSAPPAGNSSGTEPAISAPAPIPVKVGSYQVSGKQTASLYEKAELVINDTAMSWEIVLYRKNGNSERIKMEKFDDIGRNLAVFRAITIQEGGKPAYPAISLFAYMPVFSGGKIQIDLCDTRTEGVRRRLILEP
jgi:hypothetical protein